LLYKRAYSEMGFKTQFKNLAGLSEYPPFTSTRKFVRLLEYFTDDVKFSSEILSEIPFLIDFWPVNTNP
jgi:hypothetical protein